MPQRNTHTHTRDRNFYLFVCQRSIYGNEAKHGVAGRKHFVIYFKRSWTHLIFLKKKQGNVTSWMMKGELSVYHNGFQGGLLGWGHKIMNDEAIQSSLSWMSPLQQKRKYC